MAGQQAAINIFNVRSKKLINVSLIEILSKVPFSNNLDIDRPWQGSFVHPIGSLVRSDSIQDINDLAVSPLSPSILASASLDYSVRFWSLDPKHQKQPCILICGGEGHREGLLSLVSVTLLVT